MTKRRTRPPPAQRHSTIKPPIGPVHLLALFAALDLEALIDAAFPVLRAAVTCDFASAFYRNAGNGLLKSRDSRGRQYDAAFMRRSLEINPVIPLALAQRGVKILATRVGLPHSDKELRATAYFREIMEPQGWRHSVALCFWGEQPSELPIFVASVERREGSTDFSDRELANLERVHPFLDCAVNRLLEREAANNVSDTVRLVRDGAPGFAILDRDLGLIHASPIARRVCAAWGNRSGASLSGAASRTWQLPVALAAGCRELQEEWRTALRADPDTIGLRRRRLLQTHDPAVTASITLVAPKATGLAEPTFLLELDRGVRSSSPDPTVPVLRALTEAERAVALVLADGLSNQEIADRLGKTVHAVKFLLHRIYQKTGVPSRAALVAALRGRPIRRPSRRQPSPVKSS